MNGEHISFVLSEYGRFHALSFSLRDQHKEFYSEITSKITDLFELFSQNISHTDMIVTEMKKTLQLFDNENDEKAYGCFKNYIETLVENKNKFRSKNMDEYSVIAHGDCWCNNMMFKYEDADNPNKPLKMCFLDFQLLRLVSPIMDVLHYFYTASPKDVLDNYKHYMNIYYNSLCSYLKRLGSDPDKIYPRSKFDEHLKKYCTHGLCLGVSMMKIMLSESDEIPDFAEAVETGGDVMDVLNYEPRNTNYKQRIRDIVLHFVENDFI